ncbi:hypothetical protein ACL2XO_21340 [Sodalis sp. RH15]|uniref:hypothetical protein n=1 Tax=Sodalis sp. RH15 TaxID=3394330 RepID=UPI0039B3DBA1
MREELFNGLLTIAKEAVAIKNSEIKAARLTTIALPAVKSLPATVQMKKNAFAHITPVQSLTPLCTRSQKKLKHTDSRESSDGHEYLFTGKAS